MNEEQRPVTLTDFKAGLADQKQELLSTMAEQKKELLSALATKEEMRAALAGQKEELEGFMRQIETNILTAFHGYARGVATHLHTLDVGDQDIRLRLGVLEERVLALETRRPS
jgi:hypothetical protein